VGEVREVREHGGKKGPGTKDGRLSWRQRFARHGAWRTAQAPPARRAPRRLRRERARDECLAGAGRPVEQHAARRLQAEAVEELGVDEGQEDHLLQRAHVVVEAADLGG
jgi:hypothetical protein